MGLNRMMMKSNKVLKDITAEMVPYFSGDVKWIGFIDDSFGELSPNPLPNGVRVSSVAVQLTDAPIMQLRPASIKSCTFKDIDITVTHGEVADDVGKYIVSSINSGLAIPIIFHF